MKNNKGLDAISLLTDVLFQDNDSPVPSFPADYRKAQARIGAPAAQEPLPAEPTTELA